MFENMKIKKLLTMLVLSSSFLICSCSTISDFRRWQVDAINKLGIIGDDDYKSFVDELHNGLRNEDEERVAAIVGIENFSQANISNSGLMVARNYFYIEDDCRLNFEFTNECKLSYIVPIKTDIQCTGSGAVSLSKVLDAQSQREDVPTGKCTTLLHNVRSYISHGGVKLSLDDIEAYKKQEQKDSDSPVAQSKDLDKEDRNTNTSITNTSSDTTLTAAALAYQSQFEDEQAKIRAKHTRNGFVRVCMVDDPKVSGLVIKALDGRKVEISLENEDKVVTVDIDEVQLCE